MTGVDHTIACASRLTVRGCVCQPDPSPVTGIDRATEGLSESEREALREAMGGIAGHPFVTVSRAVERILAARAAQPDELRMRIEALCSKQEANMARFNSNRDHPYPAMVYTADVRAALEGDDDE